MDERTEDLLVRWVDGELSDAEREEVEVLLAHSAALRQTVADYRKIKRQGGHCGRNSVLLLQNVCRK